MQDNLELPMKICFSGYQLWLEDKRIFYFLSLFWPHLWREPSGTKCLIFQIQHSDTYRRFSVAATALIRSNISVVFIHVAVMSDFVHCYSI